MAAKTLEKPMTKDVNIINDKEADTTVIETRKDKKADSPKREKKGGAGKFVILFTILFFVGALAGIIGLNLFNIRDRYLLSTLQKIPVISGFLPSAETEQINPSVTISELQSRIALLETQLAASKEAEAASSQKNDLYVDEITRLKEFEDAQLQFKADKAEFDRLIALNDPGAYTSFYESISPENAPDLYQEAQSQAASQEELNRYVKTFSSMDEKSAARILEEMIRSDLDLVVLIISNLKAETSGAILGAMEARNAATVVKRWAPT